MQILRAALLVMLASPAFAATFTVNSADDVNDTTCDVTHCSLREAIIAANAAAGADSIVFSIPGAGVQTIQPLSAMTALSDAAGVSIDGLTQPGAVAGAPLIEISGASCAACQGLVLNAGGNTIRGLVLNRFALNGIRITAGTVTIEACFIGTNADGTSAAGNGQRGIEIVEGTAHRIGGTSASQRNVISGNGSHGITIGNFIENTLIQGNYIGTDVTGTIAVRNQFNGINDLGYSIIGGPQTGAGNVISGNGGSGINIDAVFDASIVQGNLIGLDATGTAPLGNLGNGITADGVALMIGGTSEAERNYIAGNAGSGILLSGRSPTIRGNWIGVAVDGSLPGNGAHGIHANGSATAVIGGTVPGSANRIEGNSGAGIYVQATSSTRIGPNEIRGNGGLGIDLGTLGVTPNDALDADSGANSLQNFPTVLAATASEVSGLLTTEASQTYAIALFTTSSCDPSGSGEGETFIAEQQVTTDTAGAASFTFVLTSSLSPGVSVTAIARDLSNQHTSEFSPCVVIPDSDMTLSIADSLDPVTLGDSVTWTIVVTNNGPTIAETPHVTDTLPGDVDFVSVTASQGSCLESGGTVDCSLGAVAVGATATVTIVGTPSACCSVTNTAYLVHPEDPDPSDDSATEVTNVNRRPTASSQVVNTTEDVPVGVAAVGADADGTTPQFQLVSGPSDGMLLGLLPNVTYVPDAGFHGTDAFVFQTYDGFVASAPATVTLAVANVDDAPVASDDAYSVAEGTILTVDVASGVLQDDGDQDGDAITAVLMTTASNGSLALLDDGGFVYTPDPDFYGDDSFTYRATDGTLFSGVTTVTLTVTNVADGPIAATDEYVTAEDTPLSVPSATGVLSNDGDVDVLGGQTAIPAALTAVLVTPPANGTLTLSADGAFLYEPDPDVSGPDSFTYLATDGALDSATVTVLLDVTAAADAPGMPAGTAPADAATLESGDVTFAWSASVDPDGDDVTYQLRLVHGDDAPVTLETTGTSLSQVGDDALAEGTWTWTVIAVDAGGAESAPSPVATFIVEGSGGGSDGGGCGCSLAGEARRTPAASLALGAGLFAIVLGRRRRAT